MKDLTIDKSKLTLRHALDIQSNFEDYPTREDFLYDLISVLTNNEKLNIPFQVNEIWHEFIEVPKGRSYQEYILDAVEDGWVEIIEDTSNKKFYTFKLIKHPWMKK